RRIRPLARLRRKQAGQAPRQNPPPGRVPPRQDALALLSPEQLQPHDRTIRMRNRTRQQPHQPPRQPLHRPALKQVRRVFDLPHNPTRRPILAAPLAHAHGEVKLRPPNRNRLKPRSKPRHLKARWRVVLKRQHHLEQRMARQRPRRVEHLNQPLKRNLLMAAGQQIVRAHPPTQLAHARRPGHVRPQHQRVHKEPHQIVQRTVRAPRNRAPQRDVAAPAQPAQQPNQSSLQHHEQAGSPRTPNPQNPSINPPPKKKAGAGPPPPPRSRCPAPPAATACSPHIAPQAAQAPVPPPHAAPHSSAQYPPPTPPTTPPPPQCDAAPTAARARARRAHTNAPATAAHDRAQTPPPQQLPAPPQALLPPPPRPQAKAAPRAP